MELLTYYVREAIKRNLIDEWHVWNFARKESDDAWLREQFPIIRRTPSNNEYYHVGRIDEAGTPWRCAVRADHDLHIGLLPVDRSQPAYEFVVGGWGNTKVALRSFDAADLINPDLSARQSIVELAERPTTGLLSKLQFRELAIGQTADGQTADGQTAYGQTADGLTVSVDGQPILSHAPAALRGAYDVHVMTAYGADAEWLFPEHAGAREFLYLSTRQDHPVWSDFYRYYAQLSQSDPDTIFLKSDDDVVYLQLSELQDFIDFRAAQPHYFLVSANVVNNNVCAYYQQQNGAIPQALMELELPEGGFKGTLWSSRDLATRLHDHFLDDPDAFRKLPRDVIEWRQRLSINFVAWIGRDAVYMAAYMGDDEHATSVEIPQYLGRPNCIYPGMLVGHLTFFPQDPDFEHERILGRYRELARAEGVLPG